MQMVKSGELDLALSSQPSSDEISIEFFPLFKYHVVLLTPPNHELLQKRPVTLADIAAYPLILSSPESMTRRRMEQAFKDQGLASEVVLSLDHAESIKQYVEIGMGVAIGNDFTLHPDDHNKLGVVQLDHLFPVSEIGICTLKGKFLGRAVRNFMDTLVEALAGYHVHMSEWKSEMGYPEDLIEVGSERG